MYTHFIMLLKNSTQWVLLSCALFCFLHGVSFLSQADVVNVSPGTQYAVTVGAASASSSNISPGVSRMINTNESGENHRERERERATERVLCFSLSLSECVCGCVCLIPLR